MLGPGPGPWAREAPASAPAPAEQPVISVSECHAEGRVRGSPGEERPDAPADQEPGEGWGRGPHRPLPACFPRLSIHPHPAPSLPCNRFCCFSGCPWVASVSTVPQVGTPHWGNAVSSTPAAHQLRLRSWGPWGVPLGRQGVPAVPEGPPHLEGAVLWSGLWC